MQDSYCGEGQISIEAIVKAIDRDVERGEDLVMLGYSLLLMAPLFAPVTPPRILLPAMAITIIVCVWRARKHFLSIQSKLHTTHQQLQQYRFTLAPISNVLHEYPKNPLSHGFNPLNHLNRTLKSLLGGLLVNPLWIPTFYTLGLQFEEDKQLRELNQAVMQVEKRLGLLP